MRYCTVMLLYACTVVFDMYIHVCLSLQFESEEDPRLLGRSQAWIRKIRDRFPKRNYLVRCSYAFVEYTLATPLSSTLYSTVSFLLNIFLRMSILAFTLPVTSRQLLSMLVVDMCL